MTNSGGSLVDKQQKGSVDQTDQLYMCSLCYLHSVSMSTIASHHLVARSKQKNHTLVYSAIAELLAVVMCT